MSTEPILIVKTWPFTTTVYADYIEYKSFGQKNIIPIANISEMTKELMAIEVTLTLNSGKKIKIVTGGGDKLNGFIATVSKLIGNKRGQ